MERLDYHLWHVHRGAEVAETQPRLFGKIAESLCVEQRIAGSVDERQEVVVARLRLALLTPACGAAEVGANCQYHGSSRDHGLIEMRGRELFLAFPAARHHHAVELEISHGLRACRVIEQRGEQFAAHLFVAVFTYGTSGFYCFHLSCGDFNSFTTPCLSS